MSDENSDLNHAAPVADGSAAIASQYAAETVAPQPNVLPRFTQQGESTEDPEGAKNQPGKPKTSYKDFNANDGDPGVNVKIKEILIQTDTYFVYLDQDLILRWHWNSAIDPNVAAPIFNRACELQAKSEFLRQTRRQRDLTSARRLIGEGLVIMFSTQNQQYANAALDTAEKFITQIGTETSRGWYFGPFFILFAISVIAGLILYRQGRMAITTLPLVCCLAGGIGAFISTAIGNERIPCAPTAGRLLHILEALLRYTIGFAAGLIIWLAASGNVIIGFLNSLGSNAAATSVSPWPGGTLPANVYALVAVTMLAGASERLLPSLIGRFDDSVKDTSGSK
jgi:hypothetical protein